jgi:4-hydroxybenzoate polyprenyltransferase
MKSLIAFFRLIRWPNLFFIALTQCLFYYCIIQPSLPADYYLLTHTLTPYLFPFIIAASLFIAAGGYIINDYFDINIDRVNKPSKMVIEKTIHRRGAILLHLIITTIGVGFSFYVGIKTTLIILFANIISTFLLWFYSTTFKKKLLSGNIIISALTAWTILVLYFATNTTIARTATFNVDIKLSFNHIYKLAVLYGGFAFIISLIREVVKDMEDIEGDAKYKCNTMPIAWGIPASKVFVGVWIIVLVSALAIIQFYVLQFGWWISSVYCFLLIILPLLWVIRNLYLAQNAADYHRVSTVIKFIMLAGILSMLFMR